MPAEIPDNRGGARRATDHLVELGTRRNRVHRRPRAGADRAASAGAAIRTLSRRGGWRSTSGSSSGGFTEEAAGGAVRLLDVAVPSRRSCSNADGHRVLVELRARGLAIPRDMSLVGFDEIRPCAGSTRR